ncbi:MAG: hypothetical protein JNK05_11760 [Myxococcales bacterium]|nr:hypothetical protein [Myxococcales bacterium]
MGHGPRFKLKREATSLTITRTNVDGSVTATPNTTNSKTDLYTILSVEPEPPPKGLVELTPQVAGALALLFASAKIHGSQIVPVVGAVIDAEFPGVAATLKEYTKLLKSSVDWPTSEDKKAAIDLNTAPAKLFLIGVISAGGRPSSTNLPTSFFVRGVLPEDIEFEPAIPALSASWSQSKLASAVRSWIESGPKTSTSPGSNSEPELAADFDQKDVRGWRSGDRMVVAFVSATDDQWLRGQQLEALSESGSSRASIKAQTTMWARGELFRALLTSHRIVLNRAHWIQSLVLQQLYDGVATAIEPDVPTKHRALLALIKDSVLSIFLMSYETDLLDRLAGQNLAEAQSVWKSFLDRQGARAYSPRVVRFSRDKVACERMQRIFLSNRFHEESMRTRANWNELLDNYQHRIKRRNEVDRSDESAFLAQWDKLLAIGTGTYTRSRLYTELFIGSEATDRHIVWGSIATTFGSARPLVRFCKEVLDVVYNTALPDCLGLNYVSSYDSIARPVHDYFLGPGTARGQSFSLVGLVADVARTFSDNDRRYKSNEWPALSSFAVLSLANVCALRESAEHLNVRDALFDLLNGGSAYSAGVQRLYLHYCELVRLATSMTSSREPWCPILRFELRLGTLVIQLDWIETAGKVGTYLRSNGVPVDQLNNEDLMAARARVVVADRSSSDDQRDIWLGIDLFVGQTMEAKTVYSALCDAVNTRGDLLVGIEERLDPATVNQEVSQ